ncbi:hypothetical protein BGZ83_002775 [Gryganskiella cystojenkinii]|nr:hypothetical protein BGZ83_002775 [Gryganskiella cystojenkinii]
MFASLVGILHQPSIAIRVPNDDTTFVPEEYPKIAFVAKGKVQGKLRLIHGTDDDSGIGMVSIRIWVTKESDKDGVAVDVRYVNKTLAVTLDGPSSFSALNVYHETTIQLPRSCSYMQSLSIIAPNTSFSGEHLENLLWDSVHCNLTNSTIALQALHGDNLSLHTSNASISGEFEAGHVDLGTSNASISAKLRIHDAQDGKQSRVVTKTGNASLNLHVDATSAANGLYMDSTTKNAKMIIGVLLGRATRSSYINNTTANAKVEFNLDASQSGQPLEVYSKSSNASVVASIMVPPYQLFKGHLSTSNASVTANLTEAFQGHFSVDTSNGSAVVEGSDLMFEKDKKSSKQGMRGQGQSEIKVSSSNSSSNLRFYPAGESLAESAAAQGDVKMKY